MGLETVARYSVSSVSSTRSARSVSDKRRTIKRLRRLTQAMRGTLRLSLAGGRVTSVATASGSLELARWVGSLEVAVASYDAGSDRNGSQ